MASVGEVSNQLLDARKNYTEGRDAEQNARNKFEEANPRFAKQGGIREEARVAAHEVAEIIAKAQEGLGAILDLFGQGAAVGSEIAADGSAAKESVGEGGLKAKAGSDALRGVMGNRLATDIAIGPESSAYANLINAMHMEIRGKEIAKEFSNDAESVRALIRQLGAITTKLFGVPILHGPADKLEEIEASYPYADKGIEGADWTLQSFDQAISYVDKHIEVL